MSGPLWTSVVPARCTVEYASVVPDAGIARLTTSDPLAPVVVAACGASVIDAPAPETAAVCASPGAVVAAAHVKTFPVDAMRIFAAEPVSATHVFAPVFPVTSPVMLWAAWFPAGSDPVTHPA